MVVRLPIIVAILLVPAAMADFCPLPPVGVEALRYEDHVEVTWAAVDGASAYLVYLNGELLGSSLVERFLAPLPPSTEPALYQVSALDDEGDEGGRSVPAPLRDHACIVTDFETFPYVFVHPVDCIPPV